MISAVDNVETRLNDVNGNGRTAVTSAGASTGTGAGASDRLTHALDLVLGAECTTDRQRHQFSTPPPGVRKNSGAITNAVAFLNTPPSSQSPQFDAKIETGCLSAKRNKFCGDDLDLSKSFTSPLQVSTPTFQRRASRIASKSNNSGRESRCKLPGSPQAANKAGSISNMPTLLHSNELPTDGNGSLKKTAAMNHGSTAAPGKIGMEIVPYDIPSNRINNLFD